MKSKYRDPAGKAIGSVSALVVYEDDSLAGKKLCVVGVMDLDRYPNQQDGTWGLGRIFYWV